MQEDMDAENSKRQQLCLGLIFRLISYILELSDQSLEDNKENIISLDSNLNRIFEFVCHWLEAEDCGVYAVKLLRCLVLKCKKESISNQIARDATAIVSLINYFENPVCSVSHSLAILQLLLALLQQSKSEKLILSKVTESFFDKILAPLVNNNIRYITIDRNDVEKCTFCLLLLTNFASIAKKAYFEKCCNLLQKPEIQHVLAQAMQSGNEEICEAVFEISQFEQFPQLAVAKVFFFKYTLNIDY